jgi:hypothetical protein
MEQRQATGVSEVDVVGVGAEMWKCRRDHQQMHTKCEDGFGTGRRVADITWRPRPTSRPLEWVTGRANNG